MEINNNNIIYSEKIEVNYFPIYFKVHLLLFILLNSICFVLYVNMISMFPQNIDFSFINFFLIGINVILIIITLRDYYFLKSIINKLEITTDGIKVIGSFRGITMDNLLGYNYFQDYISWEQIKTIKKMKTNKYIFKCSLISRWPVIINIDDAKLLIILKQVNREHLLKVIKK